MDKKAEALFGKLKGRKSDRQKYVLYLSKAVHDQLKTECEKQDVSLSETVEQLMKDLLESIKSRK